MNTERIGFNLNNKKIIVTAFLALWAFINLLQAVYTGILHDEAYYKLYSLHPAWGYFDHPPMIALWIKAGASLLSGTLGVRWMVCLLIPLGFYFTWRIIQDYGGSSLTWIYLIIGTVFAHIFSWVSTPDAPLLFLACIYFYVLKRYMDKEDLWSIVGLTLCIAAMVYTKYHTVLLIFFTMIASPALFKRWSLYIIGIGAGVLFLPHLMWQYQHDWPSVMYHVSGRNRLEYSFHFTTTYILNQVLVFGPLISLPVFWLIRKIPHEDAFLRVLWVTFWGFLGFFLLNSFRGWVEPHWTSPVLPCFLILGAVYLQKNSSARQAAIKWLSIATLLLLVPVRILLTQDTLAEKWGLKTEIHNWKDWALQIEAIAKDAPVVFFNSFQRPSKYTWFTGKLSTSLNNYEYRQNQFDLLPFEDEMQHRHVAIADRKYWTNATDSILPANGEKTWIQLIEPFQSFYNIPVTVDNLPDTIESFKDFNVKLSIYNPRKTPLIWKQEGYEPPYLTLTILDGKKLAYQKAYHDVWDLDGLMPQERLELEIPIYLPVAPGDYSMIISLDVCYLRPAINSGRQQLYCK
jgi:hypothetical protein